MNITSVIGPPIPRVDGGKIVGGVTRPTPDVRLPGSVYARLVTGPHANARITAEAVGRASANPAVSSSRKPA